jgi:predicted transcriptional regulator
MRVAEVMTRSLERVKPSDSISTAAQLMRERDIGMLLVEDQGGEICGLLTDRDIACRAVAEGMQADTPVEACMSREVLSCHTQDALYDAVELMKREKVRRLLVRDLDNKPVGVLAQADVSHGLGRYGLTGEMLEEISQPGSKHSQH